MGWEEGKMTADTEGFRDGLQFMSDLYQKYKVSPTPTQAAVSVGPSQQENMR